MKRTAEWRLIDVVSRYWLERYLETEQITDLAEESIPRPLQILESKLPRLIERGSVPQIDESPGHRTITEQPVGREFVDRAAGVDHTIHENWIAVSIL